MNKHSIRAEQSPCTDPYTAPIQTHIQPLLWLSHFSRVRLCATPQTAAHQVPPSLGFSRQEHWSGLPFIQTHIQPLLLLSHFSRVQLCATPQTAAQQALPSLGFSRHTAPIQTHIQPLYRHIHSPYTHHIQTHI